MNRNDEEGVIITVHKTEAQHGVVHAEPCECHEHIQVGAEEKRYLEVIDRFLGDLASLHNAVIVGCSDCGWEGFLGPGDKAADEGNKAVVDEGSCPECEGDLIDLTKDDCEHENPALEPFYDEEEILPDDT
ncbi:hypothetical protein HCTV5_24 [Halovirus HCTV-5]|uniref:hypothetical protein n=1 Tax=Halovirus HCTV-5 TaxID=1273748 RepID=UPI00033483D1|nr:hypothetical protein M200_gp024 [Halovirus HCTV-5]AGM11634.1 hypothetical protein HCTV5_24 [Halovirus HCTV-5]